jgi:hypothetical protein
MARGIAGWALQQFAGLTQREAAAVLGVGTGAAVSQQTTKWIGRMRTEPGARELAAQIEAELPPGN